MPQRIVEVVMSTFHSDDGLAMWPCHVAPPQGCAEGGGEGTAGSGGAMMHKLLCVQHTLKDEKASDAISKLATSTRSKNSMK
jgi:hypothetical protein